MEARKENMRKKLPNGEKMLKDANADLQTSFKENMINSQKSFAQADRILAAGQKQMRQMKEGSFDADHHNMFEGMSEESKQMLNKTYMAHGLPDVNNYDLNDPEQLKAYNVKAREVWDKQAEKNRGQIKGNPLDYEKQMLEIMKSSREYNKNYSMAAKKNRAAMPGRNSSEMKAVFAIQDLMEDMQNNMYDFSIKMMEISIAIRERAQASQ